jgi:hypothetical protein
MASSEENEPVARGAATAIDYGIFKQSMTIGMILISRSELKAFIISRTKLARGALEVGNQGSCERSLSAFFGAPA